MSSDAGDAPPTPAAAPPTPAPATPPPAAPPADSPEPVAAAAAAAADTSAGADNGGGVGGLYDYDIITILKWNCIILSIAVVLYAAPTILRVFRTRRYPRTACIASSLVFTKYITMVIRGFFFPEMLDTYLWETFTLLSCIISAYLLFCLTYCDDKEPVSLCLAAVVAYTGILVTLCIEGKSEIDGTLGVLFAFWTLVVGSLPLADLNGVYRGRLYLNWLNFSIDTLITVAWLAYTLVAGTTILSCVNATNLGICLLTIACRLVAKKRSSIVEDDD